MFGNDHHEMTRVSTLPQGTTDMLENRKLFQEIYKTKSYNLRRKMVERGVLRETESHIKDTVLQSVYSTHRQDHAIEQEKQRISSLEKRTATTDKINRNDSWDPGVSIRYDRVSTLSKMIPGAVPRRILRKMAHRYDNLLQSNASLVKDATDVKTPFELFCTSESKSLLEEYIKSVRESGNNSIFTKTNRRGFPIDFSKKERETIDEAKSLIHDGRFDVALGVVEEYMSQVEEHNKKIFAQLKEVEGQNEVYPSAELYFILGEVHWRKDNNQEAINYMSLSINLDPFNADSYYIRGSSYLKANDLGKGEIELQKYLKLEPSNLGVMTELGKTKRAMGKPEEACVVFTNMIKMMEQMGKSLDPHVFFLRGETLEIMGDQENSKKDFEAVVEIDSGFVSSLKMQADELEKEGKIENALRSYLSLIKLDAHNTSFYQKCAELYTKLAGEIEDDTPLPENPAEENKLQLLQKAVVMYDQCIDLGIQDESSCLLARGNLHIQLSEWRKAIMDFTKILIISPEDVSILKLRGRCYMKAGEIRDAIADFESLAALEPENIGHTDVYTALGKYYMYDQVDLLKSIAYFQTAWWIGGLKLEKISVDPIVDLSSGVQASHVEPDRFERGAEEVEQERQFQVWLMVCMCKDFLDDHARFQASIQSQSAESTMDANGRKSTSSSSTRTKPGSSSKRSKSAAGQQLEPSPVPTLRQLVLQQFDLANFRRCDGVYGAAETEFMKLWEPFMMNHCPPPPFGEYVSSSNVRKKSRK